MANKEREQLSVPIDPETKAALERLAKEQHRTVSGQVRHLIAEGLRGGVQGRRQEAA